MTWKRKSQEIIYFFFFLCSWCWGFTPVLDQIMADHPELHFRIIMGGLRPGELAQKMTDELKAYIRSHWRHVQEATGQPFDFAFFERTDFLYDTEPPARAVVTVRDLQPEKEYSFFKSLQRAFYTENVDITDENNYTSFLLDHGIDPTAFRDRFRSEDYRQVTQEDFAESRRLGISGFPSVILRNEEKVVLLTAGYQPYERLKPQIEQFFKVGK
ncbi:DsbA family protein [bacterium]|nr:DsbA family protein [bacterium]